MGLKKSHQNQEHSCTEGHDSCFEQQRTENQLLSWSPSECSTPANFQKYKLHCNGHENSSRKAQGANISASFCSLCSVVPVLPARPLAKRSPGPPILRTGAATTSPRLRRTDFSGYGRRHRTSPLHVRSSPRRRSHVALLTDEWGRECLAGGTLQVTLLTWTVSACGFSSSSSSFPPRNRTKAQRATTTNSTSWTPPHKTEPSLRRVGAREPPPPCYQLRQLRRRWRPSPARRRRRPPPRAGCGGISSSAPPTSGSARRTPLPTSPAGRAPPRPRWRPSRRRTRTEPTAAALWRRTRSSCGTATWSGSTSTRSSASSSTSAGWGSRRISCSRWSRGCSAPSPRCGT
jgi:hypothetical protein